ncbi:hypothetical protein HDC93_001736 [Streptomyces sp. AK010]|nr:hypothetical protein [Streptomyces sp. AK010]
MMRPSAVVAFWPSASSCARRSAETKTKSISWASLLCPAKPKKCVSSTSASVRRSRSASQVCMACRALSLLLAAVSPRFGSLSPQPVVGTAQFRGPVMLPHLLEGSYPSALPVTHFLDQARRRHGCPEKAPTGEVEVQRAAADADRRLGVSKAALESVTRYLALYLSEHLRERRRPRLFANSILVTRSTKKAQVRGLGRFAARRGRAACQMRATPPHRGRGLSPTGCGRRNGVGTPAELPAAPALAA